MERIIGAIRKYHGNQRRRLRGERIVVLRVHRGEEILDDDAAIGSLRASDRIEFVQIVREADGRERTTWVTSDCAPADLGEVEGYWERPIQDWIVVTPVDPLIEDGGTRGGNGHAQK